jgi:lipopolysaccharide export system permease protein
VDPFFRVITVLLVIFTGYVGALFLAKAGDGSVPASIVLYLIGLKMVIGLEVLIPTAFYLGVVIGLGRLYSDSEMTVLFAAGVSEGRVMRPVLKLGLLVAVVVAMLSLYAHPWAYRTSYELEAKALASFDFESLKPGKFYNLRAADQIIYAEGIDHATGELQEAFFQSGENGHTRIIQAKRAVFEQGELDKPPRFVFSEGRAFLFDPLGTADTRISFDRMVMPMAGYQTEEVGYKRKAAPSSYLMRSERDEDLAEYQWRVITPISTVLLGLLAVPFARSGPRQGRYGRLALAILFYAVFFNLIALAKTWVEEHWVDAWFPGVWWVLLLPLVFLIFYHYRPHRYK